MTVKDAVKKSGTPVALSGASVDAAKVLIQPGERVCHAVVANCAVDDGAKASGALVVTTHRILFCPGTVDTTSSFYLCLEDCVGVGDITGKQVGSMHIISAGHTITVELSHDLLLSLQTVILNAVAAYPNQRPLVFPRV